MRKAAIIILMFGAVICGIFILAINQWPVRKISSSVMKSEPITNKVKPILSSAPAFIKPEPEVSLIATGDIMLSRSVEQLMAKRKDFALPFKPLEKITSAADITFGNLETAILPGRPIMTGEFNFRVDPASVAGLKLAGFDLVSLANNHTPNFGQVGLKSTFAALTKDGIKYVGAGANETEASAPALIEKQGIKFGFLAYVYPDLPKGYQATENQAGVNFMNLDQLRADIASLKPQVDFVIVSMHDGVEYAAKPSQHQIEFAHTAIESGASLVIGHHPHVVQTLEKYQNGYIVYSLGNFIFDQLWSEETQRGMVIKVIFSPKQIQDIEFIPVKINSSFQPELAEAKIGQAVIGRLAASVISQPRFFWNGKEYQETISWQVNFGAAGIKNQTYQAFDLDNDNKLEEAVVVNGIGYLIKDGKALWQTDSTWQVENVLIGDFNNDNKTEVGFSLWKQGSYGPDLPFWVKENDKNISNHLFLYQLENGEMKMIWGSSALDQPILEMALVDLDQDGKNELAVLEDADAAEGATSTSHLRRDLAIWRFNDFNFVNIYKSRAGNFFDLKTDLNYINIKETK